jgi:hypothetical protein
MTARTRSTSPAGRSATGYPTRASGMGGKFFFDDDQQTPDTMNVTFEYPGKALIWEMRIWNPYGMNDIQNGVGVYGTEGMVHIGQYNRRWGFKVFDKAGKMVHHDDANETTPTSATSSTACAPASCRTPTLPAPTSRSFTAIWRTSLRGRGTTSASTPAETVINDPEANMYIRRAYRTHWGTPKLL